MNGTLKLIIAAFLILVAVPAYYSWGPGFDATWGALTIHLHGVKNSWVAFFVLMFSLFALSATFRQNLLKSAAAYDDANPVLHRRTETTALILIAIWLGYLKWMQSALLFTVSRDHGLFLNVMWNIAHGHGAWSSILGRPFFSEHFSPILYLLSLPYSVVHWAAWPLFVQTAAMIGAVAIIIHLGWRTHALRPVERLLLILFFVMNRCFQDIHDSDMHPIALGIIVPVALYALARKDLWLAFYLLLPLTFFGIQEDVSLMIFGLSLILLAQKSTRRHGVMLFALSGIAFWVNVEGAIRHFAGGASGFMSRYETMGGDMKRIVETLLLRPWVPVKLMLQPSHLVPLLKVFSYFGFLPLAAPLFLLGLIPGVMQHSLTDYAPQYQYAYHYASNLLPFLMLGTLVALSKKRWPLRWLIPGFLAVMAYSNMRAPSYARYRNPNLVALAWELGRRFEPDIKVSVQNAIGVPFSFRRNVYIFPDIKDADVIILSPTEDKMPLDAADYAKKFADLQEERGWIGEERSGLWIFKRKGLEIASFK